MRMLAAVTVIVVPNAKLREIAAAIHVRYVDLIVLQNPAGRTALNILSVEHDRAATMPVVVEFTLVYLVAHGLIAVQLETHAQSIVKQTGV